MELHCIVILSHSGDLFIEFELTRPNFLGGTTRGEFTSDFLDLAWVRKARQKMLPPGFGKLLDTGLVGKRCRRRFDESNDPLIVGTIGKTCFTSRLDPIMPGFLKPTTDRPKFLKVAKGAYVALGKVARTSSFLPGGRWQDWRRRVPPFVLTV